MADDGVVLRVAGLGKRFQFVEALRGVSFEVRRGEAVGFLGPNGAGKSTTMRIISGVIAPGSGTVTVAGHDLAAEPLACRAAIGYLPEEPPLYPDMTPESYLDHCARLKGVLASARRRSVLAAIERADLGAVARRRIKGLSKGNRQRVGLAQALISDPPLLLLDEPTSGLDPGQVLRFRDLVRTLAADRAVLISTHVLAEVEAMCSRAVVINRGTVVAASGLADLRRLAGAPRLRIRVRSGDAAPLAARLAAEGRQVSQVDGDSLLVEAGPDEARGPLALAAEACGGLRELAEEERRLEEAFRSLTGPAS